MSTRTAARPHPRVQARREEVRRRRGRRRVRAAVAVLVLFSVVGAGWLAIQSGLLDVDSVEVRGVHHADPAEVREVSGVTSGEALLLVDRGAVAGRIEELPWVLAADVSLSLPGRLVIEIEERSPVAWVALESPEGERAPVALVDGDARVLELRGTPPERLVELRMDVAVPAPGERLGEGTGAVAIAAAVPPSLRGRVVALERVPGGFELEVDGAEVVRFGPAEEIQEKWAALGAVLAELGEREVRLVDVRVPSVPAVREHDETDGDAGAETDGDAGADPGSDSGEPDGETSGEAADGAAMGVAAASWRAEPIIDHARHLQYSDLKYRLT